MTAGFIPSFLLRSKANYIKMDGSDKAIVLPTPNKSLLASYKLGLEISFPISSSLDIYFASSYRNDLYSIIAASSDLTLKRELLQFNTGVKLVLK
jgi:hypothetical protein